MARWLKFTASSGEEILLNLDNASMLAPLKNGKGTKISFGMTKDSVAVEVKETIDQIRENAGGGKR